jgi:hypothetical protein
MFFLYGEQNAEKIVWSSLNYNYDLFDLFDLMKTPLTITMIYLIYLIWFNEDYDSDGWQS